METLEIQRDQTREGKMKKILLAISVMALAVGCQRYDDQGAPGEGVEQDTMRDNGTVTNDATTPGYDTQPPPPAPGTEPAPPPPADQEPGQAEPPPPETP